jgi:hypothetical protein
MTGDNWVCDSCETHNLTTAQVCRACQRPPGSVTGTVRAVPPAAQLTQRQEAPPVFGESKHARISLTPVPVPPPPVPPPLVPPPFVRPYAPPPPVSRRPMRPGTGWRIAKLVLSGTAILLLAANCHTLIGLIPSPTPAPAAAPSPNIQAAPAGVPCPAAAAMWLPAGGTGSVLVDGYTTDRYVITVCRDSTGQLYYDGQIANQAVTNDTHISIPAQQTADGFVATNNGYVYQISGTQETVSKGGNQIELLSLNRTGP